jgi:hypothetical protein
MMNRPFRHEIIWVKLEEPLEQDLSSLREQDPSSILAPVEFVVDPALLSISRLMMDAIRSKTTGYCIVGIAGRVRSIRGFPSQ